METKHFCLLAMLCWGVQRSSSEILLRPKRNWVIQTFSIDEGYSGPFPYVLGTVGVEKNLRLFEIHGQGVDEDPKDILQINENTGEVLVLGPVDHEQFDILKLKFEALNAEDRKVDIRLGITIDILDANDNPPKFDFEMYEVTVNESTLQGFGLVTIRAIDTDSSEKNKEFSFSLVSVTPEPEGMQFYITQTADIGFISFKGCLDHEKSEKYTIIVEAKDNGKPQLSSFCTVIVTILDGNNHLPVITGQTGPARVEEGQKDVLVLRLQATDEDTKGTMAWKAKYRIDGDTDNNFRITTDPVTNEGMLYVEKHLNYEANPLKNLTISVENEVTYQQCKVLERTTTKFWKTKIIGGTTITASNLQGYLSSRTVTLTVVDVNEAPVFEKDKVLVWLRENVGVGYYLGEFTARDPDIKSASTITYIKGEDPADWVTVDPETGKITTSKIPDRESTFVKDDIYLVTVYAVDNGEPPQTSTATLSIVIKDENDNAPFLVTSKMDMCVSDEPSMAKITALDLDAEPFSGPFRFRLLGDVTDKWRIDPAHGHSVNLVKENNVYSGYHDLQLEVSDLQDMTAVYNLSVTVCDCLHPTTPNCTIRKAVGSTVQGGALGIAFLSMLLLLGLLFCALVVSCKREIIPLPDWTCSQELMGGNTERPGEDCKVIQGLVADSQIQMGSSSFQRPSFMQTDSTHDNYKATVIQGLVADSQIQMNSSSFQRPSFMQTDSTHDNYKATVIQGLVADSQVQMNSSSFQRPSFMQTDSAHDNYKAMSMSQRWKTSRVTNASSAMNMRSQQWKSQCWDSQEQEEVYQRNLLSESLQIMLVKLKTPGKELGDYEPHVYAEEGDSKHDFELDAISNPEVSFDPDMEFDLSFNTLATICMPGDIKNPSGKTEDSNFDQQIAVTRLHFIHSAVDTYKVACSAQQDCLS
ncbi:cadherin-like protein 26 isoform 2-T3 [Odontesthes bonariensis]|uniref:cadherin-like protein 26 isoform X2 n=1 Tax=Odontesthes bonariensis TaxID=219752 RepID=UPI003F5804EC